jgi:PAS domain S-box-containing protein
MVKDCIQKANNGEPQQFEFWGMRKNGEVFPKIVRVSAGNYFGMKIILAFATDITERKKAEEALKEREEKINSLFNGIHLPVFVHSFITEGFNTFIEVNNIACQRYGYSREEFLKLSPKNISSLEDSLQKGSVEGRRRLIEEGQAIFEATHITKYGKRFPVEINSIIFNWAGQKVVLSVVIDITERKQAEEALLTAKEKAEKNERQYFDLYTLIRLMSDTMPEMLWAKNLNSEYIFANKAICTGLLNATDAEEPLGKTDIFFALRERNAHPDNPEWHTFGEICRDSDTATLESMKPMQFDEFGNVKGKFLFLDVYKAPLYDSDGQLIGVVGSARDVTAAKAAENQLRKLSWAVEQSPASVVITDTEGTIEYVNPKFTEVTGYTLEEAIGQNPRILKSGDQATEVYMELWKTISAGKEWKGELHNKKKNGELYWESVLISPIKNEKGELQYFLGVKEDITEKKKIIEQLVVAKDHAEESDRLKSAFLANMSHEIRTPMNGILGFTDLLKKPNLSADDQKDFIQTIQISGERMLNTINNIVDVSKIESGLTKVDIKAVDINEKMEFVYKFFKPEIEKKGLQFSYNIGLPSEDAIILTDNEKVYGILTNLIKNAIKFTYNASVEFGYEKKGNFLEFYVKDTGVGIPKNQKEFIFERFRQGSNDYNRPYEGSGLGLSISKSYSEMLGGKIWVESEEGLGSTFYFTIPYITESTTKTELKSTVSSKQQEVKNLKILIVEDDEVSYSLLSRLVKKASKEVLHAVTGIEAIEACKNNPDLDLVLMDIRMPEMNGLEATSQIREFNKDLVIIAQTAYGFESDFKKAMEAGCNDYITKPIYSTMLFELIKKHVNK